MNEVNSFFIPVTRAKANLLRQHGCKEVFVRLKRNTELETRLLLEKPASIRGGRRHSVALERANVFGAPLTHAINDGDPIVERQIVRQEQDPEGNYGPLEQAVRALEQAVDIVEPILVRQIACQESSNDNVLGADPLVPIDDHNEDVQVEYPLGEELVGNANEEHHDSIDQASLVDDSDGIENGGEKTDTESTDGEEVVFHDANEGPNINGDGVAGEPNEELAFYDDPAESEEKDNREADEEERNEFMETDESDQIAFDTVNSF